MTRKSFVSVQTILILCFIINFAEFYTTTRKYCTLPDGATARCKPREDCDAVTEFTDANKEIPREVEFKLKEYSCGYNRKKQITHVCCPPGPLIETDEIPSPPDVTNHTNLYLIPKECGLIGIEDKIRNGENAGFNEFPWMALLSYNTSKGPNFMCGGTIINDKYILTAAHCVVDVSYPLLGVRVGEYNLATKIDCDDGDCLPPVQDLAIEKIIYPEDYNVTLYANDIALLRVTKINLTDNAKPVCLPIIDELRILEIIKGVVTGWGFIDPDNNTPAILQKVSLDRRDLSACKKYYRIEPSIRINNKQFCIGGIKKKDSCGGDSGGPLHTATRLDEDDVYVQYGIVSAGPSYCGYEGAPGLYTKVPYYMDWILDSLEP